MTSPRAFGIRVAALCWLSCTACSLALMRKPPSPVVSPDVPMDCSSSVAPPLLDLVCMPTAGFLALVAAVGTAEGGGGNPRTALALGAGGVATCAVSMVVGFSRAGRCTRFKELNARCVGGDIEACRVLTPGWSPSVASWVERPPPPREPPEPASMPATLGASGPTPRAAPEVEPAPPAASDPERTALPAVPEPESAPMPVSAEQVRTRRFVLGLRLGYGIPLGDVRAGLPIDDRVASVVPVQVEASYELWPRVALGMYFGRGSGRLDADTLRACDAAGRPCSADRYDLGVQGQYFPGARSSSLAPWLGAAAGLERLAIKYQGLLAEFEGFELVLQGGARYRIAGGVWMGPYLQLAYGQYTSVNWGSLQGPRPHGWVDLGLRCDLGW